MHISCLYSISSTLRVFSWGSWLQVFSFMFVVAGIGMTWLCSRLEKQKIIWHPQNIGIRTEVSLVAKLSFMKTEIIWKRVSEEVKELLRGKVSHAVVRVAMGTVYQKGAVNCWLRKKCCSPLITVIYFTLCMVSFRIMGATHTVGYYLFWVAASKHSLKNGKWVVRDL